MQRGGAHVFLQQTRSTAEYNTPTGYRFNGEPRRGSSGGGPISCSRTHSTSVRRCRRQSRGADGHVVRCREGSPVQLLLRPDAFGPSVGQGGCDHRGVHDERHRRPAFRCRRKDVAESLTSLLDQRTPQAGMPVCVTPSFCGPCVRSEPISRPRAPTPRGVELWRVGGGP